MIPYILVLLSTSITGAIGRIKELRPLWWIVPAAILITFSGTRFMIGADYPMYERIFSSVDPLALNFQAFPLEPGFVLLMFAVKKFTENPVIFFVVCAALTIIPACIAITRANVMPLLSLYLYITLAYYPISFNAVRQSIAVSLLLLAETYRDDKRWAWLLLSAIAPFFHISSLVASVIMLLVRLWNPRLVVLFITSIIAAATGAVALGSSFIQGIFASLNQRYMDYIDQSEGAGIGTFIVLVAHILITVAVVSFSVRSGSSHVKDASPAAYYILSIPVLAFALAVWEAGRFEPYFGVFAVIAIPSALKGSKHKTTWIVLISLAALAYFIVHISNYNGIFPYRSIWTE